MTKKRVRRGQVVVEMLLILPVFLTIVFSIMEMGNIAFWIILLNHATYECSRIGAMQAWTASTPPGGSPSDTTTLMQGVMDTIITGGGGGSKARISSAFIPTLQDPQSGNQNYDLMVTGAYDVQMIFPIMSILFSNPPPLGTCAIPAGAGKCTMSVTMRMPIEQPLFK